MMNKNFNAGPDKSADDLMISKQQHWSSPHTEAGVQAVLLIGDVLLAAAFVSYCGPFNMAFRSELVNQKWLVDLTAKAIPMTPGVKPLDMLTSDTEKAQWGNEGLPTDPLSIENGAIMVNSSRTTLMIDPQLQGIKWITNRYAACSRDPRNCHPRNDYHLCRSDNVHFPRAAYASALAEP